ncbi:MAG: SusD/RagB family nutrient-binding outer membrane lipoprotein [Cyclobacteriaceae bacterium]
MKHILKTTLCSLVVMTFVVSCDTEELHELNINPQAVNQIDLNFLFSAAELGIASNGTSGDNRYTDWRTNIGMASTAIQQLATPGGISATGNFYRDNAETSSAPFDFTYNDQLKNIAEILRQTGPGGYDAGNKVNMRNAARILKAFSILRVTDFYGAVPYFEANKGLELIYFPKYDKQSVIYADMLKELGEAAAAMSASNPDEGFKKADMIYKGDIAKWQKWAYSLMLRMAMRVSNVDPAMANTYVQKAVAGGVFTSNDDNVWIPMSIGPSEWTNQNGISRAFYPGDGGNPSFLSKRLVDFLKGTDPGTVADDDPRLMIISGGIADWNATAWLPINVSPLAQKGLPNGKDHADLEAIEGKAIVEIQTYSRINFLLLQDDDPYMIMNHAEVEFLLAEAAERGIGGVTAAATHYNAAVKSAMQMYTPFGQGVAAATTALTVTDAQVNAYLATYPYASRPALEMIGEQLWVSKFLNWWEAWADWRRTGFPVLVPSNYPGNVTGGTIPRRLMYPSTEVAGNANFTEGDVNNYTSRVWWDGGSE